MLGTLPNNGAFILSRTNPTEIVTFSYLYGSGGVIYSSIPLDYYLRGGPGPNPPRDNFANVYAPNVLAYANALLQPANVITVPVMPGWGLIAFVLLLGLFGAYQTRRKHSV